MVSLGGQQGADDAAFQPQPQPGDVPYLPCGIPHAAIATGQSSFHLSLVLAPYSARDLLVDLIDEAADRAATTVAAAPRVTSSLLRDQHPSAHEAQQERHSR